MGDRKRVLLVGATGNFGKRLLRNLTRVDGVQLMAASRDLAKAAQLVAQVKTETGFAFLDAVQFTRDDEADSQLALMKPWLVIDASGPFQGADYAFVESVLNAGAHYVDLADATDFLSGFSGAVDALARSKGLVARTGASSTPALSFAVVEKYTQGWKRRDTIDIAIVPDGVGDVGESATRGVLTYAGTDVTQFRHGRADAAKGWLGPEVIDVQDLRRRVAPVETIDAHEMPKRFGVTSRVRFMAGLQSGLEMRGLQVLSWLRCKGVLRDLRPMARLLAKGRALTRLMGTDRGGMIVRMTGLDATGVWRHLSWSIVAREGCGPNIPGLPAVAATRLLLDGVLQPGARLADDISLAKITQEFKAFPIAEEVFSWPESPTPFAGVDLTPLPKPVQEFHRLEAPVEWEGRAQVSRGRNFVSRLVGWIMGLPDAADDVAVHVSVERQDDGAEKWTRMFSQSRFHSVMSRDADGVVWERFGPLRFALGLQVRDGRLIYPILKGRALGIPMPRWILPSSDAFEKEDTEGRFRFDVRLGLPVFGLLVHYQGWLVPKTSA